MSMIRAMQVETRYSSLEAAMACLPGVAGQDGCLGVRVSGGEYERRDPGSSRSVTARWAVLVSLEQDLPDSAAYPDGCRSVVVPEWLMDEARATRDEILRRAGVSAAGD